MGGEIASAFVSLLPSMSGFQQGIEREGSGQMQGASKNLGKILTAGLLAAGAAAGAGLAEAIGREKDTDRMAAALGLSPAESKRLGGVAGDLYRDAYGASFGEVTTAVESVVASISGMSTASSADVQSVTASVLDLSTAFGTDLTEVTAGVSSLMRNGLAPDAQTALDMITKGMQSSANLGGDLLDVIGEYGSTFASVGLDGEQAIGLMNQAIAAGIPNADFAADAIRELGIVVGEGADESMAALSDLGLNAAGIRSGFLEGGEGAAAALDMVLDALRNTEDPLERSRLATELIGTQYGDFGDALLALDPSQAVSTLGEVDGAAARLGETLNNNAATNLVEFKRDVEQLFVDVMGGQVLPIVSDVAAFLADKLGPALSDAAGFMRDDVMPAAEAVFGFLAEHQNTVEVMAGLISGVLVAAFAVWATRATQAAVTNTIAWFTTATASSTSAAVQSRSALQVVVSWLFMAAQSMIAAGRMAAAWLVAMGPIGWAIAAVAGLVALVIWKWDEVKAVTARVWDWITRKISGAWDSITAWVSRRVADVIRTVVGIGAVVGRVVGFFASIKDGAVAKFTEMVDWIRGLPGSISAGIGAVSTLLYNKGADIVRGLWNGIKDMKDWLINKLTSFITDAIPDPIASALGMRSPSRVTAQLGRYVAMGLAVGMEDGAGVVRGAAVSLAQAATPSFGYPAPHVSAPRIGQLATAGAGAGGAGVSGSASLDYDRLAEAMSRRPNYLTLSDRTATELHLRGSRGALEFA
ncbi:phage tail tape measure protein [Nocardioides sp. CPCC 205120]|uniref:phage tail tape measure protein n=1 Tax=Nocardioides sp. CPCC 205120 TaxID=3406462 RepID=UPI003B508A39